ncbi:MAG TPA: hypothetical protein VFH27_10315 [Longimicrobiaceae bacterium]|nr:hypothetical protein [Longimicrobiaceae bacterium]
MIPSSTIRIEGQDLTTALPPEVVRGLGVVAGAELLWLDDGRGGYHVRTASDQTRRVMEAHEDAITEYGDVFRALTG